MGMMRNGAERDKAPVRDSIDPFGGREETDESD